MMVVVFLLLELVVVVVVMLVPVAMVGDVDGDVGGHNPGFP